jgi:hypothetical protein
VAEELLHGTASRVITVFEQVGGETMAKSVTANLFGNAGGEGGLADSFLQATFVYMVAADG